MWILSWLKRGDKNGVRITVVHNHEILIATVWTNWESSSVFRVEFSDVLDVNAQFLWLWPWWFLGCRGGVTMWLVIQIRFCWSHTLSTLDKISHDIFVRQWTKFSSIVVGDSWTRILITIFNSTETSVLHQEACYWMEVPYQGLNTWEVLGNENMQVRPFSISR